MFLIFIKYWLDSVNLTEFSDLTLPSTVNRSLLFASHNDYLSCTVKIDIFNRFVGKFKYLLNVIKYNWKYLFKKLYKT